MTDMRAEFEKAHPRPKSVTWLDAAQCYIPRAYSATRTATNYNEEFLKLKEQPND